MSYTKEPVYGNHLGIVINKEDPEYRGRVQVWIPYMSNTLHSGWNDELKDKKFKHIHESGALTPALVEELKNVLPWAECAAPIMGGGTCAKYNSYTGITDTNPAKTFGPRSEAEPLKDPTLNGLINKATELNKGTNRKLNFSNDGWGGRCLTASTTTAAALLNYKPLASEKTSLHGGFSAASVATGDNRSFQNSGYYGEPFTPVSGLYKPQLGDQLALEGGKVQDDGLRYGHILTCIDDGRISGNEKWVSDNTGLEVSNDYLFGGRKTEKYYNPKILRLNEEGLKRAEETMQITEKSVTQTPVDTAEIPATSFNSSSKATDSDRSPKSFSDTGFSQNLVNAIKVWEAGKDNSGFISTAEPDAGTSTITVGYGTEAPIGTVMNEEQAEAALIEDLKGRSSIVNSKLNEKNINLTQSQKEALISYTFNRGPNGLDELLNNSGDTWDTIGPNMSKYWGKNESAKQGLINRRNNELEYANSNGTSGGNFNSSGTDSSPMVNPIPNFNPATYPASLSGAQASGFVSIPDAGAKVFVFFLGGDIQKPVYFAGLLEPESYRKVVQSSSPEAKQNESKDNRSSVTGVVQQGSGLTLNNNYSVNQETKLPSIEDNVSLNNAVGSSLSFSSANTNITTPNDHTNKTAGTYTGTGFAKNLNYNTINTTCVEDTKRVGFSDEKTNNEIIKASADLKKIVNDIQKKKVEEIKENSKKGEKVPCPLCSTSYAVDRASSFSKKATSLLRKIKLPYFSYAVDTLEFLTQLIFVPFCSIVPGSALGECGNSECEKGMIPSPQKPIEEANKKAATELASKQNEISKLEQKLGNGGTHTVVATKDIIFSAGLELNDAPCYAETNNKSTNIRLKASDNKQELIKGSADGMKNVVYCSPIQTPGGNIILRGGNAVKIIAGSPGIELLTKGKLSLNCGSLEILTSDGEIVVGSKNHTTIKGKVVTIDANDRSGKGGVEINSPHLTCKGFSVEGDMGVKGGVRIDGELSIPYLNTVSQRMNSDDGMSPDQRIPFANWAVGAAQQNDASNSTRLAVTHYFMKDALLLLSNIVKYIMEIFNTILTNTVVETNTTGYGIGYGYVQLYNWQHNHMEDPKPHNHDYIIPRGTYSIDDSSVKKSAVQPNPVPTRARKNGMGMDGGPKSLGGCGGFGGWGGGNYKGRRQKYNKLNSFGLFDSVKGFNGTRLQDNNVKYKYDKDGSITFTVDEKPCDVK